MEESKIIFSTAKLAKEKGFNIITNDIFVEEIRVGENEFKILEFSNQSIHIDLYQFDTSWQKYFRRPTQSLLQKWLREVHKIDIRIVYERVFWHYVLYKLPSEKDIKFANSKEHQDGDLWLDSEMLNNEWYLQEYNSYEEALEIGLQEALKLIK